MSTTSVEAKVSWGKPEQIYFRRRIYAILATLWTNEGAKNSATTLRGREESGPAVVTGCRNSHASTSSPVKHCKAFWSFFSQQHQWLPGKRSSSILQQLHISWAAIIRQTDDWERVETSGSPPQSKISKARFAPNLPLNLLLCYYFKTRTPAWDSGRSTHWGLIRATRCARVFFFFFNIYAHFTSSWSPSRRILNRDPFGADSWTLGR